MDATEILQNVLFSEIKEEILKLNAKFIESYFIAWIMSPTIEKPVVFKGLNTNEDKIFYVNSISYRSRYNTVRNKFWEYCSKRLCYVIRKT